MEEFKNLEKQRKVPFFEIQIKFAKKVAEIKNISFQKALLQNTAIYKEFHLPWPLDEENKIWQNYLKIIRDKIDEKEIAQLTYNFSMDVLSKSNKEKEERESEKLSLFDCVYNIDEKEVKLHFHPPVGKKFSLTDPNEVLGITSSFKNFLEDIKRMYPGAEKISATSWLLGIEALSGIFPEDFIKSFKQEKNYMASLAMWGQFLKSNGVRESAISQFKEKFEKAKSMDDIEEAFPLKVFSGSCDIREFYKKYEIIEDVIELNK